MYDERELGQILEGIKNLSLRYSAQETRLDTLDTRVQTLATSFAGQPNRCLESFEKRFAARDQLVALEETRTIIVRAAIYIFCGLVVGLGAAVAYIRGLV